MGYEDDEVARSRLFKAIQGSYRGLASYRKLTKSLVKEYAGSGYGTNTDSERPMLLALLNQTVEAYQMALVANRPRCMITSSKMDLLYFARQYELAVNNLIKEIRLEATLRKWVMDAYFCVGVIKLHMADSPEVMLEENVWANPGQPFASNLPLDNFAYDMNAPRFEQIQFAADFYRIPHADLKSDVYTQENVAEITPTSKKFGNSDTLLESISRGDKIDDDELEPMVDLCDVWIPREKRIYTFAMDRSGSDTITLKGKPVAVMDWIGHEDGPYVLLGLGEVPENIMPVSPADQISELARLINLLMDKQSRQARGQKTVHTYTPGSKTDMEKIRKTGDRRTVEVKEETKIEQINFPGADPGNQAFVGGLVQLFDRMAGNLTAMLGLGAQTGTASQEELIHGAVGKREAQMQYRVMDATVKVVRGLAYMLYNDRNKVIPGQIDIEGAPGYSVDATWTPEDREGEPSDFDLDIDIYSMAYRTPQQRAQAILSLINGVFAPFMQLIQQQGGQLNMVKLNDILSNLTSEPLLKEIIQFVEPADGPEDELQAAAKPQSTKREYIRRNVSGGSPQAQATESQNAWLEMAQAQG